MKVRTLLSACTIAVALSGLTGCVSNKKYAELQRDHQMLSQDYTTLQNSLNDEQKRRTTAEALLEAAKKANEQLRQDYTTLQGTLNSSISQNSQGNANISKLVDQINESNKYIRRLVDAKSKSDSLNMVLTNNLTRSLSPSERDEVNVRVLKGVVYISLADNMLFESGSYQVNSRALQTLGKVAKIIKDYPNYDVLVEGNTDDVPISRTNIRNNWDLSTLRASSIVQVLQNEFGVSPKRLTAAGRGEYNNLVPNDTEYGRQRNRRTEIIITPQLDEFLDLIDKAPEEK